MRETQENAPSQHEQALSHILQDESLVAPLRKRRMKQRMSQEQVRQVVERTIEYVNQVLALSHPQDVQDYHICYFLAVTSERGTSSRKEQKKFISAYRDTFKTILTEIVEDSQRLIPQKLIALVIQYYTFHLPEGQPSPREIEKTVRSWAIFHRYGKVLWKYISEAKRQELEEQWKRYDVEHTIATIETALRLQKKL